MGCLLPTLIPYPGALVGWQEPSFTPCTFSRGIWALAVQPSSKCVVYPACSSGSSHRPALPQHGAFAESVGSQAFLASGTVSYIQRKQNHSCVYSSALISWPLRIIFGLRSKSLEVAWIFLQFDLCHFWTLIVLPVTFTCSGHSFLVCWTFWQDPFLSSSMTFVQESCHLTKGLCRSSGIVF